MAQHTQRLPLAVASDLHICEAIRKHRENVVFVTQVHAGLGECLGLANPDNFQSR